MSAVTAYKMQNLFYSLIKLFQYLLADHADRTKQYCGLRFFFLFAAFQPVWAGWPTGIL